MHDDVCGNTDGWGREGGGLGCTLRRARPPIAAAAVHLRNAAQGRACQSRNHRLQ